MKSIIISMCLLALFVGCTNGVTKAQWDNAENLCSSNNGLAGVSNNVFTTFIYCENGAKFDYPRE